ncbi:MAG: hypothetical protein IKZ53_03780 [Selenomonadaceae bacterium]|nr:hypothetical protein [Selenomonadaceae bacterium]
MNNRTHSRTCTLLLILAGFFFVRTALLPLSYDDYSYAFIWDGEHGGNLAAMNVDSPEIATRQRVESFSDIFQSLKSHYFTWGGRIFAHGLIQFFVWLGKPAFDVANTLIFIFFVLTIFKLSNRQFKLSQAALVWIFLSLFIFGAYSINTMFWLTGSCNYLWMAFFQLFFLTPYVEALRSSEAGNSILTFLLMILLGLAAGWSNEAGALATIFLTLMLLATYKIRRGKVPSWMVAGLASLIIGCAFMIFAPGNFVRLELAHPNFHYTLEIFLANLTGSFLHIVLVDLIILLPVLIYFLRRDFGRLNIAEILMLEFAAVGLLVPTMMLFSPEFNLRSTMPSMTFILVAATSAILKLDWQRFNPTLNLPKRFLRGVSTTLATVLTTYCLTLIYVDISIFNATRRQI